ncbi:hypothetical protein [Polynucleobacter sp. CS-Odin-A6]|uniref:hypothetical protein n=1 Tax=Polynucleobacter sp. CS-Odin-A6 TaxID=2689106 RepID=UPI001DDCBE31|nr:hypothetical protein [Polynucleobacter sp. CS-Odin-A6]MBU3621491.1 hypothetical protein [Polynucleobacter sp. CS-Odin-A6]
MIQFFRLSFFLISSSLLLLACSVDKLEARLQADPQCKSVLNQKTGALMPCPGTDKEFYRSIPALNVVASESSQTQALASKTLSSQVASPKIAVPSPECKPQLHQKSGSLMPCPTP